MATPAKPTQSKRTPAAKVADPAAAPARDGPALAQVLVSPEHAVAELEAGDLPLETALQRFEDGVRLARRGTSLLDAVEQRVEVLLEGSDEPAPFPGAELTGDDDDDDL